MRTSKDYKQIALDTLRGSWKIAVLVTLVAILLGGTVISGPEIQLEIEDSWAKAVVSFLGITVASLGGSPDSSIGIFLNEYIKILLIGSIIIQILFLLLGSIIEIGYNRFHLTLLD